MVCLKKFGSSLSEKIFENVFGHCPVLITEAKGSIASSSTLKQSDWQIRRERGGGRMRDMEIEFEREGDRKTER